ncbi:MAG TPA: hypothetical protein VET23_12580 [Chitinophagaceae bacterium]|nr:hypothetical protein [Chitinophagaceae bacterium]
MSDKIPDKNIHWRNKLDNLEQLPGEMFNKELAWDKLHYRMQGNKGDKKIWWHWMAAACLLFALLIIGLNYPKNNPQISNNETTITASKRTGNSVSTNVEKIGGQNIKTGLRTYANAVTVINKSHQTNRTVIPAETINKTSSNDTVSIRMNVETGNIILQTINTTPMTAMTFPAKKKLKVVHINELGDPITESSDMVRSPDIHTFQVKLANGEVFVDPPIASRTTSFTIFKAKPF